MRIELFIIIITGLLMYNTYYDNKYIELIKKNTKILKVGMYGLIGLSILIFFKKYPKQTPSLISYFNDFVKFIPLDKNSKDVISPIFNFTEKAINSNNNMLYNENIQNPQNPQFKRMLNSGIITQNNNVNTNTNTTKRSVSESKKKFVASRQQWACAHCNTPLDYTFEVDHIVELQHGGTNHVDNLEALCRNCHGKKTFRSKL